MNPEDPRHGTNAGYIRHTRTGIPSCAPCRAARVHYEKRRLFDAHSKGGRLINPVGTRRRIQALVALGWTYPRIGAELGISGSAVQRTAAGYSASIRRDIADRAAEVYQRMSTALPPTATRQEKRDASYARAVAKRNGWFPPGAWLNIDDPDETPDPGWSPRSVKARPKDELLEEFDWLTSQGESPHAAARRLGVRLDTVSTYRNAVTRAEAC